MGVSEMGKRKGLWETLTKYGPPPEVLFFLLLFIELGLAYLPVEVTRVYSPISHFLGEFIPAINVASTERAQMYMALTLPFLPVQIALLFVCEWNEPRHFHFIPLPWAGETISSKLVVLFIIQILMTLGFAYVCLSGAVGGLYVSAFLRDNYSGFGLWYGWAVSRLAILGYFVAVLVFSIRVWIERPARIK